MVEKSCVLCENHASETQDAQVKKSLYMNYTILVEFKDFSRLLSDFPVLFKADLIFKDFSRTSSRFKYFSSLLKP